MEKQIVFVEYVPNIINLKIARVLKLKNYKTILITFSKVNKELYNKAFDEVICLEIKHKLNSENLLKIRRNIFNGNWKRFFKRIRNLNPYISQITGPDMLTLMIMAFLKGPKIYFAYDIWNFYGKKNSIKNPGIKEFIQQMIEKKGMKRADGILHKGPRGELKFLKYNLKKPDLAISPGCLDEWCLPVVQKKNKEIHLVFAGAPYPDYDYRLSFFEIVKEITKQKIHFHTYGRCIFPEDNKKYSKLEKINPYFHFHEAVPPEILKKEIVKYDYGIVFEFCDNSKINPLWTKTANANKLFDYIEAGIPVLGNNQLEHVSKIINENGVGITIDYKDLKNLREILKKQDYRRIRENIKKAQHNLSWNKKFINELERFYRIVTKIY